MPRPYTGGMPKLFSLSVFFPALNEKKNIEATVRKAARILPSVADHYEIIIVNDGSKDTTAALSRRLAATIPRVKVVEHETNKGYGGALLSGFKAAKYQYVFFTDADLQFDLNDLTKLLPYLEEYRAVIGYREKRRDSLMRLLNAWGGNRLNRFLFGLKVRDIDCAFKVFERDLIAHLPIKSRGAMISAEMLIRLKRNGIEFKQVPVKHLPRRFGAATGAKISVIVKAFSEMMRLYINELGNRTYVEAVKFGMVGVLNTFIDIAAYFTLTRGTVFFGTLPVLAKALSFSLGTFSSFTLNRTWTFGVEGPMRFEHFAKFYVIAGASLAVNVLSTFIFLHYFNLFDMVAVALATLITFIWNFTLSRTYVFTRSELRAKNQ